MAVMVGMSGQTKLMPGFRADGSVASATVPQLILPQCAPRSSYLFQNVSSALMWVESGPARISATLTNGVVTSCTVLNAGFGYTYAPRILFMGGGNAGNGRDLGAAYPGARSPSNVATAHCVMTSDGYGTGGLKVGSVVIDNGGAGYAIAPYVFVENDPNDVYGCADPYVAGVGSGMQLYAGQSLYEAHNVVVTDQIAVYCATAASRFFCRYTS